MQLNTNNVRAWTHTHTCAIHTHDMRWTYYTSYFASFLVCTIMSIHKSPNPMATEPQLITHTGIACEYLYLVCDYNYLDWGQYNSSRSRYRIGCCLRWITCFTQRELMQKVRHFYLTATYCKQWHEKLVLLDYSMSVMWKVRQFYWTT